MTNKDHVQAATAKDALIYETDSKKGESESVWKAREQSLYEITQKFLDSILESQKRY